MGPGGGEEQVEGEEKQGRKRRRGGWGRAREVLCGDVRRVWMGAEGGGGENKARLPGGEGTDVRAIGGVAPTGRRAGAAPVGGTNASRHRRLPAPAAHYACNVAGVPALGRGWAARGVAHHFFFGSSSLFPPLGVASAQRPPRHSGGVLYSTLQAPPSPHPLPPASHGPWWREGGAAGQSAASPCPPPPLSAPPPPPPPPSHNPLSIRSSGSTSTRTPPSWWLSPYDRERAQTRLKRCHVLTELC